MSCTPEHVEPVIDSLLVHEFLVCSLLPDATLVEDQNSVGMADGGKPVRDDEGGMSGSHARDGLLDEIFRLGVHA